MERRTLLQSLIASAAFSTVNKMTGRTALAEGESPKTIVYFFQRGGNDAVNTCVPYTKPGTPTLINPGYTSKRLRLALSHPDDIDAVEEAKVYDLHDLDASDTANTSNVNYTQDPDKRFGLHPALGKPINPFYYNNAPPVLPNMMDIWKAGNLAVYPSCSYNNSSRSHFKGQDLIEFSNNSVTSADGWLNRYLQLNPTQAILRSASIGGNLQKALRGAQIVPSFKFLSQFSLSPKSPYDLFLEGTGTGDGTVDRFYDQIPDSRKDYRDLTHELGKQLLINLENIADTDPPGTNTDIEKYGYPISTSDEEFKPTTFGKQLRDLAHLIKADIGLEVAMASRGSWDHHNKMGSYLTHIDAAEIGTAHHNRLSEYGQALAAFYRDLADTPDNKIDDVVCFSMTEFGRTVKENANWGTDHGVGGAAFMFGGKVKGGVYGTDGNNGSKGGLNGTINPNSTPYPYDLTNNLQSGRYLPMTVNYKDCIGDMLVNHGGITQQQLSTVLPQHTYTPVTGFTDSTA